MTERTSTVQLRLFEATVDMKGGAVHTSSKPLVTILGSGQTEAGHPLGNVDLQASPCGESAGTGDFKSLGMRPVGQTWTLRWVTQTACLE